ncbi:MAG TPA: hypothetical protein VG815_08970, partial [Chloroflexota bacterium]|nr:hypothetical protein [Chloroflexota bacterium]
GPAPDPNTGMQACDSTVSMTQDGGRHWKRVLGLTSECQAIGWFSGAKEGWEASNENAKCDSDGCPTEVLRQTRNGGKSWTMPQGLHSQKWTGMTGFAQELQFASGRRGWITFQLGSSLNTAGGIAATSDAGRTWKRYLPCYEVEPGGVSSVAADTLWLAGTWVSYCSQSRQSGLFRSIDWGVHWQQVRPTF